jgi:hypothetical protein
MGHVPYIGFATSSHDIVMTYLHVFFFLKTNGCHISEPIYQVNNAQRIPLLFKIENIMQWKHMIFLLFY